jgi:uncharacterized protein YjeT (DUF2065 family)
MSLDWQDLLTAFALVLILEGIAPFINPAGWREMVARIAKFPDAQIRVVGLGVMVTGVVLLTLLRSL